MERYTVAFPRTRMAAEKFKKHFRESMVEFRTDLRNVSQRRRKAMERYRTRIPFQFRIDSTGCGLLPDGQGLETVTQSLHPNSVCIPVANGE